MSGLQLLPRTLRGTEFSSLFSTSAPPRVGTHSLLADVKLVINSALFYGGMQLVSLVDAGASFGSLKDGYKLFSMQSQNLRFVFDL